MAGGILDNARNRLPARWQTQTLPTLYGVDNYGTLPGVQAHAAFAQEAGHALPTGYDGEPVQVVETTAGPVEVMPGETVEQAITRTASEDPRYTGATAVIGGQPQYRGGYDYSDFGGKDPTGVSLGGLRKTFLGGGNNPQYDGIAKYTGRVAGDTGIFGETLSQGVIDSAQQTAQDFHAQRHGRGSEHWSAGQEIQFKQGKINAAGFPINPDGTVKGSTFDTRTPEQIEQEKFTVTGILPAIKEAITSYPEQRKKFQESFQEDLKKSASGDLGPTSGFGANKKLAKWESDSARDNSAVADHFAITDARRAGADTWTDSAGRTHTFIGKRDSKPASSSGGGGDSGGSDSSGSDKVVCTAMNEDYGFGAYRQAIWLKYSEDHLTKAHEVGYHAMFLPLLSIRKKWYGKPVYALLKHIARHRTADLRAEMQGKKRDRIGQAWRLILEPLVYTIGRIKGAK